MFKGVKRVSDNSYFSSYIGNIIRIVIFAGVLISLAVVSTGIVSFTNAKNSVIKKSKSVDMVYIIKSMAEKIDGRIERAKETSFLIARDPVNIRWLQGMEKDEELGKMVLERMNDVAVSYDYSNTFISSKKTLHYYFRENEKNTDDSNKMTTLSDTNPQDTWFFEVIADAKPISLNVNFDRVMKDTFLFVNAIITNKEEPIGITGVGMSLSEISSEFQQSKVGKQSNLWMIDESGKIQLSEKLEHRGENIDQFMPQETIKQIYRDIKENQAGIMVSQYTKSNGDIVDIAYQKLRSSDWLLVFQIPREESMYVINSLKSSTIFTVVLTLLFFLLVLYLISRKIANPYKQALSLNIELEKKVAERTQELTEINNKVMDSIDYAKRMQEAILPSGLDMNRAFQDHFIIWRPRDVVGGDFYWLREIEDTTVFAVGDCTGHGVPGALMSMTVNAILYHIVTNISHDDPAVIIRELNSLLKQSLNKSFSPGYVDDGLDIGVCCIVNKSEMLFAGAKINLYIKKGEELSVIEAYRKGIGYSDTDIDQSLSTAKVAIHEGDVYLMTSDGFIHQNGGDNNFPYGFKRLVSILKGNNSSLAALKDEIEDSLKEYMKDNAQRDDIALLAFKVK